MRFLRTVFAVMLVVCGAADAHAQMAGPRPRGAERAVFGGGQGTFDQSLGVYTNAGWTYYDALRRNEAPLGQRVPDSLSFGQASATLAYSFFQPYLRAGAAATAFTYYRDSDKEWFRYHSYSANANTGHTFQLGRKTNFTVGQSITYQPSYFGTVVAGSITQPLDIADPSQSLPPDVTAIRGHSLSSDSSATLTRTLSRRLSLDGTYRIGRSWTFGRSDDYDLWSQTGGASLRFQMTRHLSLRAGYRYTDTVIATDQDPHFQQHSADIGLDYNQGGTIQLTRRTTMQLSGGATAVADTHRNQHYLVLGSVVLDHELGRTWSASLGYRRHVDFSTLYREPLLLDTVTAGFGGLLAPRLSFRSFGGYSHGTVGFGTSGNSYGQANASATLQLALIRYVAVSASYSYYYRALGDQVVVSRDLLDHSESQSVRVFLTAYAPLFHRARRANATR